MVTPACSIAALTCSWYSSDNHVIGNRIPCWLIPIADIAHFSWVWGYKWSGASIDGLDHLARWLEQIGERDAVKRGQAVPEPVDLDKMLLEADKAAEKVRGILA